MTIKIVVLEASPILREGVSALIARDPELEVVGKARNGLEAVRLGKELYNGPSILNN